jgi:hypothetical protein
MKKNLLLFALFIALTVNHSYCQSWVNAEIDDSGCSAYFPYIPEWELSYAEDSSMVWVGEVSDGEIFYGVICVEFSEGFDYDVSRDELITVAESYLDYLRGEFNIVSQTGYVTGWTMESNEDATGITDNWVDNEGDPWAVKTWIDPYNMAVMYIYSSPDIPFTDNQDFFFNSFRFPEWDEE